SMRPHLVIASAAILRQSASSATLALASSVSAPCSSHARATSLAGATRLAELMTMFQPFLASSTALAAPMPDPEPVMIATLRVMDSCFLVSYGIVNGSPTAAQYG